MNDSRFLTIPPYGSLREIPTEGEMNGMAAEDITSGRGDFVLVRRDDLQVALDCIDSQANVSPARRSQAIARLTAALQRFSAQRVSHQGDH